jgi:hypothetical protein
MPEVKLYNQNKKWKFKGLEHGIADPNLMIQYLET